MTPILLAAPAAEPLTLAEAKAWLRVDSGDEDAVISALIAAARMTVETAARRLMITQSWRFVADYWPADGILRLPLAPVAGITAIRVFDVANAAQTVSPALYRLETGRDPPLLVLNGPVPQPGRITGGIEIDATCGYGAGSSAVPEPLRHAVRLLVARWFENRGDEATAGGVLPADVALLIAPFRRPRL